MIKFSELKLDPRVLTAIAEAGYETPTPIQAGAIPPALEGRDVLGIAQTGTGKTASFTLPVITLLGRGRARARMPRSLVLCPTRELAAQVAENFDIYAKHTRLTKALLIGGVSFGEQDKLIDRGVDVLIATPGRLLDHFERGKLLLTGVQIMVVDEADRMLDMGFIPDIERIFQLTPFTRQTLFFSATMAPEIERITNTFLHTPERIEVARQATTSETITQRLVEITPTRRDQSAKQKRELLRALIESEGEALKNAIIFCNRKTEVDIVAKSLKKHGYDAAPIHGDLDQSQRTRTLEGFREGTLRFLIASDVAARGLDIPAVSHVFNFDLPSHAEDYVHRIGRTGRAGRQGTAISLGTPADDKYLQAIEGLVKHALPRVEVPEGFSLSNRSSDNAERDDNKRGGNEARRSGRGRDKGRNRDRDAEKPVAAQSEDQLAAVSEPAVISPVDEAPVTAPQAEAVQRQPEAGRERAEDRGRNHNRDRNNRDSNRRGSDRRDNDRDGTTVGMGDHVPDFMLSSFHPSFIDRGHAPDEADEAAPVEAEVETKPEVEADPAPAVAKRAPRTRSRGKGKAKTAGDSDVAEQTATEPQVETSTPAVHSSEAPAPQEAPAPKGAAEKPAPKPRRRASRAKKPEAEAAAAETTDEAAAAEPAAAKPRRTRRKKADASEAETANAPAAAEGAEPAAKPRRPRRKKAEAAAPDEA